MRLAAFWASAALLAYTYVLFPLLLALRGLLLNRPHRTDDIHPRVSLVIAVHNEEDAITDKLANIDALDYPADRLEVIIASDGSDDATNSIIAGHAGRPIRLLRCPRQGKAPALNEAVAAASGEILVFSDANSEYAPDAITRLVRPFADALVGGVAGNQVYARSRGVAQAVKGERAYWSYDRMLKIAESRAGSAVSATGAIYAIRRGLFRPIPDGVTDDFFTSTGVVAQGHRLVFAADAIAYESPAATGPLEFARKVRIMTRGLRGLAIQRGLLDPTRHGFYAVQLLSHKLLRRLMGIPLVGLLLISPTLWHHGTLYRVATTGQVAFYALAALGIVRPAATRHRFVALPTYFCLATVASMMATWNVVRGRRIDRWEPLRR